MHGSLRKAAGSIRCYASHVPTRVPIIPLTKPPPPPQPRSPPTSEASSSSSKQSSDEKSTSSQAGPPPTQSSSTSTLSPPRPDPYAKPKYPPSSLPKPRLDYASLLADPEQTTRNHLLRRSGLPLGTDHIPHLQRLRSTQLLLLDKLTSVKGKQKEITNAIKANLGDRDDHHRQAKKLKVRVGEYESHLAETEAELLELGLVLPNSTHPDVPIGPEENAITLERFGPEPIPTDSKRDHLRIATYYDLLDQDASTTSTGSSWVYLKGTLALLEQALINYALSIAIRHGFVPVSPPDVIKEDIAWRCGFLPRDPTSSAASQTYHLSTDNLCLAGTAEIPLSAMFANQIIPGEGLPKKVVGVGRAFRAEAGARGSDTRGLYRVHQFSKLELFAVTTMEGSEGMMEEIRDVQRQIAQGLGLSAKVLDMPTEELGASAYRKYDMEAWMPGRGKWGEITSTSNCTDYQSRRLNIRYRPPSTDPSSSSSSALPFAHTLNGTAAAIPRLLIALLENGVRLTTDTEEGYEGLGLPKVLERFWVGGKEVGLGRGRIEWV